MKNTDADASVINATTDNITAILVHGIPLSMRAWAMLNNVRIHSRADRMRNVWTMRADHFLANISSNGTARHKVTIRVSPACMKWAAIKSELKKTGISKIKLISIFR